MFILRQIGAKLAAGAVASLAAATRYPFRLVDVPPKYKLRVSAGKVAAAYGTVAPSGSKLLALPESYTAGQRLQVCIKVNDLAKVVIVSPDHGTSTFLVNATNGLTNGTHDGCLIWCGSVSSITLWAPASSTAGVLYELFAYELPDLTVSTSWRDGARSLGVSA